MSAFDYSIIYSDMSSKAAKRKSKKGAAGTASGDQSPRSDVGDATPPLTGRTVESDSAPLVGVNAEAVPVPPLRTSPPSEDRPVREFGEVEQEAKSVYNALVEDTPPEIAVASTPSNREKPVIDSTITEIDTTVTATVVSDCSGPSWCRSIFTCCGGRK